MTPIKLIVGLGNPGPEYRDTRHNAGFWWVDKLAAELKATLAREAKFHGLVGRVRHDSHDIWLLKPTTYMNRSGQAVVALALYYKILPHEILVVHDEIDLPPGAVKMKNGGGNAGHNGLRDLTAHLTTADFWRLRLGVGHPGDKAAVIGAVLDRPSKEEQALIDDAIARSLELWPLIAAGNFEAAMLKLHTKTGVRSQESGSKEQGSEDNGHES
ncbi:MAG: aminoacyl-tRNA hydrolase [Burkholderiales bacterium]|nr:aminoacyl-tRNA hydrolase [Burkholderiales bacterium]